jgi:hypothetical protein
MKKKEIVNLLEDFHEDLERFNQRIQKLEKNGNNPIPAGWGTAVDKFKELEAKEAERRQGIHSLLVRIEALEIQFRERIELSEKLILANKKALLASREKGRVK